MGPFSAVSFRDPDGCLYVNGDSVLRRMNPQPAQAVLEFLSTAAAADLVRTGRLISSRRLSETETPHPPGNDEWLQHERVWFPSFPYEWPAEMLRGAGLLTLEIAEASLPAGFELKDATPFNILYRGSLPVFIDLLSVQRFDGRSSTWHAYSQFVQTFLLPLLAERITGLPMRSVFSANRDGLTPADVRNLPGLWRSRAGWALVLLPALLERRDANPTPAARGEQEMEVAQFVRRRLYRGLRRHLHSLSPREPLPDDVSLYAKDYGQRVPQDAELKMRMIESWLDRVKPRRVLDIGANTGQYSFVAARLGASVVAIDKSPGAIGLLWRRAFAECADLLPLVVDIGRPTAAVGWCNCEHESFLDRASGQFDAVLLLALIHHLMINERAPLESLFDLLATLTRDTLMAEFVSREDENFIRICRGRDRLFQDWTQERFENAAIRRFRIEAREPLPGGTRCLYLLRK